MERYLRLKLRGGKFSKVPPKRSLAMGKIRGKNNRSTEVQFRLALVRAGIRGWRLHASLPGRPDFYFARQKIAIFVDGCFWHGCPRCGHIPRTNQKFWRAKIERNKERAIKWDGLLKKEKIRILHLWECEIPDRVPAFLLNLKKTLNKRSQAANSDH